jgi:hypothetical protein
MHLKYVLPALVLGSALVAFPAVAGGGGHHQSGGDQSSGYNPWSAHGGGSSDHQSSSYGTWSGHTSHANDDQDSAGGAAPSTSHDRGTSAHSNNAVTNPWTGQSDRHHDPKGGVTGAANGNPRLPHHDWSAASRRDWIRSHDHSGPWNGNWNHGTRHTVNRASFHFSAHDYRHFNRWEQNRWRHGHWHHGYHHGRYGWWWYLNGGWFFYANPVYPYPLYLSDNAYYDDYYYDDGDHYDRDYDDYSGQPASDGYWYYCRDPQGYYPDVRTCRTDWQRVSPRDHDQDRGGYDNDEGDQGRYDNDDRDQGRYDNSPGDDRGYNNDGPDDRDGDDDGPDNGPDNGDDNGPPDNGPPGPHN